MEDGGMVVQNLKCFLSVGFVVGFLDAGFSECLRSLWS